MQGVQHYLQKTKQKDLSDTPVSIPQLFFHSCSIIDQIKPLQFIVIESKRAGAFLIPGKLH